MTLKWTKNRSIFESHRATHSYANGVDVPRDTMMSMRQQTSLMWKNSNEPTKLVFYITGLHTFVFVRSNSLRFNFLGKKKMRQRFAHVENIRTN